MNKEVNGLAKYVGEHILPVLDTVEMQTVMQIVGILKRKYGRTRIEELEELMTDWMNFKANEYEDEDEYLLAMERLIARKEEKKVKDKEWNSIWMMIETKKRKGIENYQLQELRNVVKAGGEDVMKDFREKYRALKVESNRGKATDMYYMGKQSLSRQRFHSQRTRRDSQGRYHYQERKGRSNSRGRQYHRRYYRRASVQPRDFSRDMRSFSRPRNN